MTRIPQKTPLLSNLGLIVGLLVFSSGHAQPGQGVPNGWRTYIDPSGIYKLNYPPTWQVLSKGTALVITSPEAPDVRGVFGITPRPADAKIEDTVNTEFADPDRSSDLQRSPARIGDLPAIKVWGSKKGNPQIRIVEYYVQKGTKQYYILFQAPHSGMAHFSSVFNTMISSMKFLR